MNEELYLNQYRNEFVKHLIDENPFCKTKLVDGRDEGKYLIASQPITDSFDSKTSEGLIQTYKFMHGSEPFVVGKLECEFFKKNAVAYLGLIELYGAKYSNLGLGTKMLQVFEAETLDKSIRQISGIFSPFKPEIASQNAVASFYFKNGYGLCCDYRDSKKDILYKNFDANNNPIPPMRNYEDTEKYKLTMLPYLSDDAFEALKDSYLKFSQEDYGNFDIYEL